MPWTAHVGEGKTFETPDQYYQAITSKSVDQLSDPKAAAAFMQQHYPEQQIRSMYGDTTYKDGQVGVGGAQFQSGQIPGTHLLGGHHFVTDQAALDAAIKAQQAQAPAGPAPGPTPTETPAAAPADLTSTQQAIQDLIGKVRSIVDTAPMTPDEALQSDYGQQLIGAADTMRDRAMREARAQLAASGALYPDDTRAASRFAQEGAEHASMLAGQILPKLLADTRAQRATGLSELYNLIGAKAGEESRVLADAMNLFSTTAPYTMMTQHQRQMLPWTIAQIMGETVQGSPYSPHMEHAPGISGAASEESVPARQYVESRGGKIAWRRGPDGGNIVTINGRDIDVEGSGGINLNGRIHLPQEVLDAALGVG